MTLSLYTCCKEDAPVYKPSADFIMYESGIPSWEYYWENIDRDTFGGGNINFEAIDTSKGIEYEWQIGLENIKGKRRVSRDFSNVPDKSNIPIELRVHYPGKKSDTIIRIFNVKKDPDYTDIFKRANWVFVNDKDSKDTLRIRFHRKSFVGSDRDTLFINNCKRYINHMNYTSFELAFDGSVGTDNYLPCSYLYAMNKIFIYIDNINKNKAYLKLEYGINNQWVPQTFTGYTIK